MKKTIVKRTMMMTLAASKRLTKMVATQETMALRRTKKMMVS